MTRRLETVDSKQPKGRTMLHILFSLTPVFGALSFIIGVDHFGS